MRRPSAGEDNSVYSLGENMRWRGVRPRSSEVRCMADVLCMRVYDEAGPEPCVGRKLVGNTGGGVKLLGPPNFECCW